ncbi:MAG: hypothetical protein WB767_01775 [Nocardioides sp.]
MLIRRSPALVALFFALVMSASLIQTRDQLAQLNLLTEAPAAIGTLVTGAASVATNLWAGATVTGIFLIIAGLVGAYSLVADHELQHAADRPHYDTN